MKQFYTYVFWDPIKDQPFYVGKGSGDRTKHNDRNRFVQSRIKRLNNNHIVEVINTTNETAAFWLERVLIAAYGRTDIKTGCLLNRTEGGEPPAHITPHTEATKKVISGKMKAYYATHDHPRPWLGKKGSPTQIASARKLMTENNPMLKEANRKYHSDRMKRMNAERYA